MSYLPERNLAVCKVADEINILSTKHVQLPQISTGGVQKR